MNLVHAALLLKRGEPTVEYGGATVAIATNILASPLIRTFGLAKPSKLSSRQS